MAKFIHINLVSAQLFPNVIPTLGAEHDVAKVVLVLAGNAFFEQAKDLELFYARHGINKVEVYKVPDENNYRELRYHAETLFSKLQTLHPDCGFVLNATGGNKPMAFAFAKTFDHREKRSFVIYLETKHNQINYLSDDESLQSPAYKAVLDIEGYLFLGGFSVKHMVSPQSKAHQAIIQREPISQALFELSEYNNVISTLNFLAHKTGFDTPSNFTSAVPLPQNVWFELKKGIDVLVTHELAKQENDMLVFTSGESARYVGGVWFEELCYLAAIEAGIEHVATSVDGHALPRHKQVNEDDVGNEFDLICVNNNQALFGEAKTINWAKNGKGQEVALKLESLKSLYGGTMAKGAVFSALRFNDSTKSRIRNIRNLSSLEVNSVKQLVNFFKDWKANTERH